MSDRRAGSERRSGWWQGSPPLTDSAARLGRSDSADARAVGAAQQRVIDSASNDPHLSDRARWSIFGTDKRS
jgi:hypothetical protein